MGLIQGATVPDAASGTCSARRATCMTICTIAGGFGTGYTLGDNRVGMDPETFDLSKLVVLWGANVLSTHPHLWRPHPRGAEERRARRRHRSDPDPNGRGVRLAPRADAGHATPRSRSACCTSCWPRAGKIVSSSSERTVGWEAFRRAHPGVSALARRRDHRPSGRSPSSSWASDWPRPADGHPYRHRHSAPRRRRHGGADDHVHSRRHRRLALSGRRRPLRHARLLRPGLGGTVARRPADAATPARCTMTRLGEGLLELDDPPVKALFVYAQQPGRQHSAPDEGPPRAGARGPVHRRRRALHDRHRALRGHRAAGHDADRAPRSADRVRAPVHRLERAGRRAARRVPADDGDLPAPRARDGPRRAGAVRQRRDDGASAAGQRASVARRHHARGAEGPRLDAARTIRIRSSRSRRVSDAVRGSWSSYPTGWRRPDWTRSPATRRRTRRRSATRRSLASIRSPSSRPPTTTS